MNQKKAGNFKDFGTAHVQKSKFWINLSTSGNPDLLSHRAAEE